MPSDKLLVLCVGSINYLTALTFQIVLLASSVTSNEPSFSAASPTGLPYTLSFSRSAIKPVRKSSGLPAGFPFTKGREKGIWEEEGRSCVEGKEKG